MRKRWRFLGMPMPPHIPCNPRDILWNSFAKLPTSDRAPTPWSVFRIRHLLQYAVHAFFHENGFFHVASPIITASDAEGAGEMFRVTTADPANPVKNENGDVDHSRDFFGKETHLTVSGQLEAELFAMGLSKVYTFGPTFRAENSNTSRHLAEFWMIEPEVAFMELEGNMTLAENLMRYVIGYVMEYGDEDLIFLDKRLADEEKGKLQNERSPMD